MSYIKFGCALLISLFFSTSQLYAGNGSHGPGAQEHGNGPGPGPGHMKTGIPTGYLLLM